MMIHGAVARGLPHRTIVTARQNQRRVEIANQVKKIPLTIAKTGEAHYGKAHHQSLVAAKRIKTLHPPRVAEVEIFGKVVIGGQVMKRSQLHLLLKNNRRHLLLKSLQ